MDYFLTPEERAAYARGGARRAAAQRRLKEPLRTIKTQQERMSPKRVKHQQADMVVGAVAAADAADAAADATILLQLRCRLQPA